ncbi:uncharacterized protein LOC100183526 [Ciona intestinalis]
MEENTSPSGRERLARIMRGCASSAANKFRYYGDYFAGVKDRCFRNSSKPKPDLSPDVECSVPGCRAEISRSRKAEIQQKVEAWRVVVLASFAAVGLFALILSLILPEWFVLSELGGRVQGHIGYFQRCIYGPLPNSKRCIHEIISEAAAPVGLFLISIASGFGSIVFGARRLCLTQCKPAMDDARSATYQRMRSLLVVSGGSCTCAVSVFTYLYNDYLVPISASYVLGWLASFILLFGGIVGFCFKNPRPSIVPAGQMNWNRRDLTKENKVSSSRKKSTVSTISSSRRQSFNSDKMGRPKLGTVRHHPTDAALR